MAVGLLRNSPIVADVINAIGCQHRAYLIVRQRAGISFTSLSEKCLQEQL